MPLKSRAVSIWLWLGCAMVVVQILLGGITRLTDSGLSITEWNVIRGTIPPLNEVEWAQSFEKYKTFAAKQYTSIHKTMTLSEFKRIYFWEYFHRLWARFMGFVFIIPFLYFLVRGKLESKILRRLFFVIFLASLSAIFGWIMVASGLNDDKRTWVNAYNLLIHLILATSLFSYLTYTYYQYAFRGSEKRIELQSYLLFRLMGVVLFLQIGLGALMAGMKAGLVFPYPFMIFKIDLVRSILASNSSLHAIDWNNYEPNASIKIMVQIVHRLTAYALLLLSLWFFIINRAKMFIAPSFLLYYMILFLQITLGVLTVMNCIGKISLYYGVLHQFVAFLVLASYLWILFASKRKK